MQKSSNVFVGCCTHIMYRCSYIYVNDKNCCFNDKMCILVDWSWKQAMLKKIYHNNFALNDNSLFKTQQRTLSHMQACMIHYKYNGFSRSGSVLHHIPMVVATFSAFELYKLVSSTVRRIFHFPNVFTLHIWVWCQIHLSHPSHSQLCILCGVGFRRF